MLYNKLKKVSSIMYEIDGIFQPFIWSLRRGDDLSYNYKVLQELINIRNEVDLTVTSSTDYESKSYGSK
ncbi:Uncharacterised protein [Legionella sainthelensi]|uniref:Uncharacterized protein n=1 Tax=Legionella sainthelensi TaxID=28087 RepID=A0A2H5FI84_9GAMM|nr:hypothetical protein CAB17_03660 [Legionella sainthelensi]VEB39335.1 Uncharacterised protein [Legionella sainthelensi]